MATEDIGSLLVRIEADMKNFKTSMDKAASVMEDTQKRANSLSQGIKNAFSFAGGFAIFDLIKKGFEGSVKAGFEFDKVMEQNKIAFESMLGSADKANDILGKLSKMAAETPFEFPELATAAKKMLAFGFEANKIPSMLKNIGDAAAGLGLGADGVNRITTALGQMQAKGKISAQEMMQLTEAGIPAWDILAKAMGKSTAEVMKLSEKGLLPARKSIDMLVAGMEEKFPNMMEKQSKSFAGLMSTVKDNVQITFGKILEPAFNNMTSTVLPAMVKSLDDFTKRIGNEGVGNAVQSLVLSFDKLLPVLVGVATTLGTYKVIFTIDAAMKAWKASTIAMTFAQGGLNAVLAANPIGAVATAIGLLVTAISFLVMKQQKAINDMKEQLIDGYVKERDIAIQAIDDQHKVRLDSLQKQQDAESNAHDERLQNIQTEYNNEIKSIDKTQSSMKKNLSERKSLLESSHSKTMKQLQDEYGTFEKDHKSKIDLIKDEMALRKEQYEKDQDVIKTTYEENIQKIKDEFGVFEEKSKSKVDLIKEEYSTQKSLVNEILELSKDAATAESDSFSNTYDAILDKAKDVHDEKIKMYEEEYLKSVSLINQDLAAKVKGFQEEIKKINAKTDEEDKIAKEQFDKQKILNLQTKVDGAKTDEERSTANKNLAEEINKQNREKELENRKIQINSLNNQIKDAVTKANEKKQNALIILQGQIKDENIEITKQTDFKITETQRERKEKEKEETLKYNAAKKSLDDEYTKFITVHNNEMTKINEQRVKKETSETAKYNAAKKALDNEDIRIDSFKETYQAKLDTQLKMKQDSENDKFKAVQKRIKDEQDAEDKAILAQKKKIEDDAKLRISAAAAEAAAKVDMDKLYRESSYLGQGVPVLDFMAKGMEKFHGAMHNLGVPGYADGVTNAKGGVALVGERGPELVNLPKGSDVIPNKQTQQMMGNVNYDGMFKGAVFNVRSDNDAKLIAREIFNLQQGRSRAGGVIAAT
jgi:tape measure domain-containing protein